MKDLSPDDVFNGLLGFGLFPEKLPPFLSSVDFLNFCKTQEESFFEKGEFGFIIYENTRSINVPRTLSIPNPIAYRNLCNSIAENWENIVTHFDAVTSKDKYKISRIHIRKLKNEEKIFTFQYGEDLDLFNENESIFDMYHKNYKVDDNPGITYLIGSHYIVKADISNCFPSIYTHSIPWALVGKSTSKKNKFNRDLWYNKLDLYTRNLKHGETHGILIGPHASNLLSELVLTKVDSELSRDYKYIRNIDDYTCYVESHEAAENFLIKLSEELKKFGLQLNHKKTEITKLPITSNEDWICKINSFMFIKEKDTLNFNEVRSFLDIALALMKDNNDNSAILNYAMKMIYKKSMSSNAEDYYIKTIHHLVIIYPYLVHLIDDYLFKPFNVDVEIIGEFARNLLDLGANKRINELISYSIYYAIKYNFKFKCKSYEDIFYIAEANKDCTVMLLAYLYQTKHDTSKFMKQKYCSLAEGLLDEIDLYWLFIYEVLPASKLKGNWNHMKKKKITFILDEFRVQKNKKLNIDFKINKEK